MAKSTKETIMFYIREKSTGNVLQTPYSVDVQEHLSTGKWELMNKGVVADKVKAAASSIALTKRGGDVHIKSIDDVEKELNAKPYEEETTSEEELEIPKRKIKKRIQKEESSE